MPSAIEEHFLDLSFMEILVRVFQFVPPAQNKEYISCLDKVQLKIKKQRENLGIFDMNQISRTGSRYSLTMFLASIFFLEGSTNTFQISCGMLTVTLFDVEDITGLNPLGENIIPTIETKNEFVVEHFSFKNFIIDHHNKESA